MSNSVIDYHELSVPERIFLVEEIWDSIAKDTLNEPISALHRAELEGRVKDIQQNPDDCKPWKTVLERIEKSL